MSATPSINMCCADYHNPNADEQPNVRFTDPDVTDSERTYATMMHLLTLGNVIGFVLVPLVVQIVLWLVKRDESDFIDDHGKEVINFHLSVIIWGIVGTLLMAVCIGIPMLIALGLVTLIAPILNAIRANRGEFVRYPVTIRFFS